MTDPIVQPPPDAPAPRRRRARHWRPLRPLMRRLTRGRRCEAMLATWAFFEAMFWPILPDFLLIPMAAARPQRWRSLVVAAWVGSVVGSVTMIAITLIQPAAASDLAMLFPMTKPVMFNRIDAILQRLGTAGLLLQSVSGVPARLWIVRAVDTWPIWLFITLLSLSRLVRMTCAAWISARVGRIPLLRRFGLPCLIAYIGVAIGVIWQVSRI